MGIQRSSMFLASIALGGAFSVSAEAANPLPELRLDTQVQVFVNTLAADGPHAESQDLTGPSPDLFGESHSVRPPSGGANATAHAGYGVLGVSVDSSISNVPLPPISGLAYASSSGHADAYFTDVLRVDGGALNGQAGSLIVPWSFIGGGASASVAGPFPRPDQSSSVTWQLNVTSRQSNGGFLGSTVAGGTFFTDDATATEYSSFHTLAGHAEVMDSYAYGSGLPTLWREIPILFGQSVTLLAEMHVDFSSWAGNREMDPNDPSYLQLRSAQAVGDLGHTLRWGGISAVLDQYGNAVTTWSVDAASGTDYSVAIDVAAPVPEPGTWALLLVGLLGFGLIAAPRSSRAQQTKRAGEPEFH